MQGNDVSSNQTNQDQWQCNHVECKETVQSCIADNVVAAQPQGQVRTNQRNSREQVHDYLRAPIGHLAPWQEVAEEGLAHQAQENRTTKNPNELAWLLI